MMHVLDMRLGPVKTVTILIQLLSLTVCRYRQLQDPAAPNRDPQLQPRCPENTP